MLRLVLCLVSAVVAVAAQNITVVVPPTGQIIFSSPNFPAPSPPLTRAFTLINAPIGSHIKFDSLFFELGENPTPRCVGQHIKFTDPVTDAQIGTGGGLFCGRNGPKALRVKQSSVLIEFKGHPTVPSRGFQISVEFTFNSNAFSVGEHSLTCSESGAVTFSEVNPITNKSEDFGKFCRTNKPIKFQSKTNVVTVTLEGDTYLTYPGFNITAGVYVPDCPFDKVACKGNATVCLKPSQLCDSIQNCPDASDETNCPSFCGVPLIPPNVGGTSRIIAGTAAVPHSWPWHVQVGGCGGTIIDKWWVLTAAHCGVRPGSIIRAGLHSLRFPYGDMLAQTLTAAEVVRHPRYTCVGLGEACHYDFCLVKLREPIKLSPHVAPVCLADAKDSLPDQRCITVGMGGTTAFNATDDEDFVASRRLSDGVQTGSDAGDMTVLQQVEAVVTTHAACNAKYAGYLGDPNPVKEDSMICVSTGSNCYGDSGSSLVCPDARGPADSNWRSCVVGLGCGDIRYPTIFGRVTGFLDWIADVTGVVPPIAAEAMVDPTAATVPPTTSESVRPTTSESVRPTTDEFVWPTTDVQPTGNPVVLGTSAASTSNPVSPQATAVPTATGDSAPTETGTSAAPTVVSTPSTGSSIRSNTLWVAVLAVCFFVSLYK
ncbi:putative Chymotrypsin B [Hypsibius exemplaris]|uniref:Chymotrypsin B n=1 Tax=Hypsibius exemplaris TaxID=2072580 RepID=A0A1W0WKV7_HYPEX|nr:putative Chymotrypsin B [Hypsibius exemplaris]